MSNRYIVIRDYVHSTLALVDTNTQRVIANFYLDNDANSICKMLNDKEAAAAVTISQEATAKQADKPVTSRQYGTVDWLVRKWGLKEDSVLILDIKEVVRNAKS